VSVVNARGYCGGLRPDSRRAVAEWSLCGGAYDEGRRLPMSRAARQEREYGCINGDDSECRAIAHGKRCRVDARCSRRGEVDVDVDELSTIEGPIRAPSSLTRNHRHD
jgi:hypothetical protein